MAPDPPSFLPTYALDQALSGVSAGLVSTLCMQPLDLLKVQLQVSTHSTTSTRDKGALSTLRTITRGLKEIVKSEKVGLKGLYRGIGSNLVGNTSSWGLYFLWYVLSLLVPVKEVDA